MINKKSIIKLNLELVLMLANKAYNEVLNKKSTEIKKYEPRKLDKIIDDIVSKKFLKVL